MSFYQGGNSGDAARLARLMLTSSDAELLGGRLQEMQGYVELVDALATQGTDARTTVLAPSPIDSPTSQRHSSSSAS